jgi:hypothetical protein
MKLIDRLLEVVVHQLPHAISAIYYEFSNRSVTCNIPIPYLNLHLEAG